MAAGHERRHVSFNCGIPDASTDASKKDDQHLGPVDARQQRSERAPVLEQKSGQPAHTQKNDFVVECRVQTPLHHSCTTHSQSGRKSRNKVCASTRPESSNRVSRDDALTGDGRVLGSV